MRNTMRRRRYRGLRLAALACAVGAMAIGPAVSLAAEARDGFRLAGKDSDELKSLGSKGAKSKSNPSPFNSTPKGGNYSSAPAPKAPKASSKSATPKAGAIKLPKGTTLASPEDGPAAARPAAPAVPKAAPTLVEQAQAALAKSGQYSGKIDGTINPDTSAALAAYQQAQGLPQTGRLDAATIGKMGLGRP